jgi:hypothetical protein
LSGGPAIASLVSQHRQTADDDSVPAARWSTECRSTPFESEPAPGDGIEVVLTNGEAVRIGTDDAERLLAALTKPS